MTNFRQVWTYLDKVVYPVRINLDESRPIWTCFDHFGLVKISHLEIIQTKLDESRTIQQVRVKN